ncbi:hypothetical protein [Nostoc sp. ATCC 53789]|uniref:hypothetical protein n=1 Tax=Nostoc sp. ATCC 53789 TaxID=76335 RepID=UPI001FD83740|nr:hypothetical protein [Nostoc sp. ATCC 53789]
MSSDRFLCSIQAHGMSIAMPIVQSLLRHAQAGGFGIETADAYRNALGGSAPA